MEIETYICQIPHCVRENFAFLHTVHSVKITEILSYFLLDKTFVKATVLHSKEVTITKELISRNFYFRLHSVEITGIHSHAFLAKISLK